VNQFKEASVLSRASARPGAPASATTAEQAGQRVSFGATGLPHA
jgi:hypothetical protein